MAKVDVVSTDRIRPWQIVNFFSLNPSSIKDTLVILDWWFPGNPQMEQFREFVDSHPPRFLPYLVGPKEVVVEREL